ncbi:MAG: hypothetical protein ABI315_07800 [Bacteroidia bacterium]
MKKSLSLVAVAAMLALVSCGPSAAEKAAKEKATQDSIAAVESAKAAEEAAKAQSMVDSTNAFNAAKEAEAKRVTDSIESAKSKPGKTKPQTPKKVEVKPGQGRG